MKKSHDQFVKDLQGSQSSVTAVSEYLQRKAYSVMLPKIRIAPTTEQRYDYQDEGDLFILKKMQIKGSSQDFHSVNELYPNYPTLIVDEQYKIDAQLSEPPQGYWIVNKSKTGAVYIPWDTKKHWTSFQANDRLQGGRLCTFCSCPKQYARYIDLTIK